MENIQDDTINKLFLTRRGSGNIDCLKIQDKTSRIPSGFLWRNDMAKDLIDKKTKQVLAEKLQQELQDEVNLSIFVGQENKEHCEVKKRINNLPSHYILLKLL